MGRSAFRYQRRGNQLNGCLKIMADYFLFRALLGCVVMLCWAGSYHVMGQSEVPELEEKHLKLAAHQAISSLETLINFIGDPNTPEYNLKRYVSEGSYGEIFENSRARIADDLIPDRTVIPNIEVGQYLQNIHIHYPTGLKMHFEGINITDFMQQNQFVHLTINTQCRLSGTLIDGQKRDLTYPRDIHFTGKKLTDGNWHIKITSITFPTEYQLSITDVGTPQTIKSNATLDEAKEILANLKQQAKQNFTSDSLQKIKIQQDISNANANFETRKDLSKQASREADAALSALSAIEKQLEEVKAQKEAAKAKDDLDLAAQLKQEQKALVQQYDAAEQAYHASKSYQQEQKNKELSAGIKVNDLEKSIVEQEQAARERQLKDQQAIAAAEAKVKSLEDDLERQLRAQQLALLKQQQFNDSLQLIKEAISLRDYLEGKAIALQLKQAHPEKSEVAPLLQHIEEKIEEEEQLKQELAAAREREEKYLLALDQVKKAFESKSYQAAKTKCEALEKNFPEKNDAAYWMDKIVDKLEEEAALATLEKARLEKEQAYQSALQQVKTTFEQGQLKESRALCQQWIKDFPEKSEPSGWLKKIDAKIKAESDRLAAEEANRKNEIKFQRALATADSLFGLNDFDKAKIHYQEAVNFRSNAAHPLTRIREIEQLNIAYMDHISKADNFFENRQYPQASVDYRKATMIKPLKTYPKTQLDKIEKIMNDRRKADLIFSQGAEYYNNGEFKQAIPEFNKVLELVPDHEDALYFKAFAKQVMQDFEGAMVDYGNLLYYKPEHKLGYYNRGEIKQYLMKYQSAIDDFTRAIQIDPAFAKGYFSRAYVFRVIGQFDRAKTDLKSAEQLGYSLSLIEQEREEIKSRQNLDQQKETTTKALPVASKELTKKTISATGPTDQYKEPEQEDSKRKKHTPEAPREPENSSTKEGEDLETAKINKTPVTAAENKPVQESGNIAPEKSKRKKKKDKIDPLKNLIDTATRSTLYVISERVFYRSSNMGKKKMNVLGQVSYGTPVEVIKLDQDWGIHTQDDHILYVWRKNLVGSKEFHEFNALIADIQSRKKLHLINYKRAILHYINRQGFMGAMSDSLQLKIYEKLQKKEVWQLYGSAINPEYVSVSTGYFTNVVRKDLACIITNKESNVSKLLIFSFDEEYQETLMLDMDLPSGNYYFKRLIKGNEGEKWFQGQYKKNSQKKIKDVLDYDGILLHSNDTEVTYHNILVLFGGQKFQEFKQEFD